MPEWAQLLGGPPPKDPLERGHWYGVVDRLNHGMLRVSGPDAVGIMIHEDFVHVANREPDRVTRIPATGFRRKEPGQPTPMMSFYGGCPKGHRINKLAIAAVEADCTECGRTYPVEDERHI